MQFDDLEDRLRILEKLCESLQEQLYPAFLQILLVVQRHGDQTARVRVAETLAHAVAIERLPEGRMNAWGSSQRAGGTSFAMVRSLGPVEYLCSWYAQPAGLQPLSAAAFRTALSGLLTLINTSEQGRDLYQARLLADTEDPLMGALSAQTRQGLRELATQWQQGCAAEQCPDIYLNALSTGDSLTRLQLNPFT